MPTKRASHDIKDDELSNQVDQSELLGLLGYNVRRAYLVTQMQFDTQMERLDLRQADFAVLSILRHNSGVNQKALAEALAIAPPNLATLLDRLEARGYLVRQRSTDDKRIQMVTLTTQGTKIHTQALTAAQKADEVAVQALSTSERERLRWLLSQIFAA